MSPLEIAAVAISFLGIWLTAKRWMLCWPGTLLAWALYFKDPEDNIVECYVHTPWHVSQPYGTPIDFSQSDQEIWDATEAASLANPSFMTAEAFRTQLQARLDQARAT